MNFNSEQLGFDAAHFQNRMARLWHNEGPNQVNEELDMLNRDELIELLMLNIGAQSRRTLR